MQNKKEGRPRTLKSPSRLNLLIESEAKKKASRMAFKKNLSISQFINRLVLDYKECK